MATRQPISPQNSAGSDFIVNNNVGTVIGLLTVPINSPFPPNSNSLPAVLVLDQSNRVWNLLNVIPASLLPSIPSSLLPQANEIEFNYRFQGGF